MKVYSKTGIFADTDKPTQEAPEATEAVETQTHAELIERSQNAIKCASEAIQAGKPAEEAPEPTAYERYVELKASSPAKAGLFWRQNKDAILACLND